MRLAEQIARAFQLSEPYVRGVAGTASQRYKEFPIMKADGKSFRLIEQPSKELKLLQRWLVRRIFDLLPTHDCAHAYVRGRSINTNASVHRGARFVSRLDFENFFPSLKSTDVEALLSRNRSAVGEPALDQDDIGLISALSCRFGRLTIGAPCSPTLSNKLLYELDTRLATIAAEYTVNYTRYADDLYFSSSRPNVLFPVCEKVALAIADSAGPILKINEKKTYHASRKKRMAVTGLRITPQGSVSVGHELKRKIRVFAHKASKKTIDEKDFSWLRGMLAYVSSIEPHFVERIKLKYGLG